MQFTPEEKQSLKKMMMFLVKRKHQETGGHGGFHPMDLLPLLEEMATDGEIASRDTLHCNKYFLTNK